MKEINYQHPYVSLLCLNLTVELCRYYRVAFVILYWNASRSEVILSSFQRTEKSRAKQRQKIRCQSLRDQIRRRGLRLLKSGLS